MTEKILILIGVMLVSIGTYFYSDNSISHQYSYNGGLFKNVFASVSPDSYHVNTGSVNWDKGTDDVTFSLSDTTASSVSVSTTFVAPPPRDSH